MWRIKNNILFKAAVFMVALAVTLFFVNVEEITAQSSQDVLICIDPGHGGRDPGAIGPTGLTEKEVNLDISIRLKNKLQEAGYRVVMTRETDLYKSLEERVQIANSNGADIFVSIHNNAFVLPGPNGTETYYCTYSPGISKNLATCIHNDIISQINTYNRGVKTANFYVLKNTYMPSALIEGVFISNPDEESKLRDAAFREKIAAGVFNGINRFLNTFDLVSYKASIDDLNNTPSSFLPGETKSFNIKVTNNSSSFTWQYEGENKVDISYHIYDGYGKIIAYDGLRTYLPRDILPGESITIPIRVKAPSIIGDYTVEYDMCHEGITWFSARGNATLKRSIKVENTQNIQAFVTRFYQQCLGREPDAGGLSVQVNALTSGSLTGAQLAYNFIFSPEFLSRNVSSSEFLYIMYRAFFDREPDTGGYNNWMDYINSRKTRAWVLAGFVNSTEFKNLCSRYGITAGLLSASDIKNAPTYTSPPPSQEESVPANTNVQAFVTRFYQQCLGREPDAGGLSVQVNALTSGSLTGAQLAYNFIFSPEFLSRNVSNSEFLYIMYRAFFDREPDTGGYNNWMDYINSGKTRADVLAGFVNSVEFTNLCSRYGIAAGSLSASDIKNAPTYTPPPSQEENITDNTNVIGNASATEEQLLNLFVSRNSSEIDRARRLAPLYIKWGNTFNIRYDIAWAQMCHETGFLQFTGIVPPEANNFCGLGATGATDENGNYVYNSFATEELGIIAHYIHLAWYVCSDHLDIVDSEGDLYCSTKYDPRHFGTGHNYNGSSNLGCLNERWAPSTTYTAKIIQFGNEIYN